MIRSSEHLHRLLEADVDLQVNRDVGVSGDLRRLYGTLRDFLAGPEGPVLSARLYTMLIESGVGQVDSDCSTRTLSWPETARQAYAAYADSAGGKNFRGEPMPEWLQLPEAIQNAWIAAVQRTADVLGGRA